jgi:hypothetical protein
VTAGGVAVNAHGYQRLTHDLDLVVGLERANVAAALRALRSLGYRPVLPVRMEDFADPGQRGEWVAERDLQVFSLVSDEHPDTTVDLFATEPFDFDAEYEQGLEVEVAPGVPLRYVRLTTLIAMKQATGRGRDADDVEHLVWILERGGPGGGRVREAEAWDAATWEGSRRAQLERSLGLSARERLGALSELARASAGLMRRGP